MFTSVSEDAENVDNVEELPPDGELDDSITG